MEQERAVRLIRRHWDEHAMSQKGWRIAWHDRRLGYSPSTKTVTFSLAEMRRLTPKQMAVRAQQLIGYAISPPKPGERHKWSLKPARRKRKTEPTARIKRTKELLEAWQRKERFAKNKVRKYQRRLRAHERSVRAEVRRLMAATESRASESGDSIASELPDLRSGDDSATGRSGTAPS